MYGTSAAPSSSSVLIPFIRNAEGLAEAFNTNVIGTFNVTQALLPSLKKGKTKAVLVVTSLGGSIELQPVFYQYFQGSSDPARNMFGYRVSKAALNCSK